MPEHLNVGNVEVSVPLGLEASTTPV